MEMIPLQIQELLNAKLCHDLANPLGTLQLSVDHLLSLSKNMGKQQEAEFQKVTNLIEKASSSAIQKHQIYRLAYGNADSTDGYTLGDLSKIIHKYNKHTKFTFETFDPLNTPFPSYWGKIFLNLYLLSTEIIPLGGIIKSHFLNKKLYLELSGPFKISIDPDFLDKDIDIKTIQMHYTKLLCAHIQKKINIENQKDIITLSLD